MATDDAAMADRLDRYLDRLADGPDRSPNGRQTIEPELAATVRRLRARDDAPTADRAYGDRLLEDLMGASAYPGPFRFNFTPDLATTPAGQAALRPASPPARRLDTSRPRWMLAQFATAALLVLTLGSVYLAFVARQLSDKRPGDVPIVGPAPSGEPVEFLWQTRGDPDLPLNDPINPAIDPQGNLWVVDGRNSRFQIFAPDGTFLDAWGTRGSGEGQFDFVDPLIAGGYGQADIEFDAAGNLYVADPGNDRIQKFGPDRAFLTAWGGEGEGDGQFFGLNNMAIDGQGRIYAFDQHRRDVQVFAGDGRFLAAWDVDATGGIAVAPDGNLWMTDWSGHRVLTYSPDGALLATWGDSGIGAEQMLNPNHAIVDRHGRVYVADYGNNRVQVFGADGRLLTGWGEFGLDPGDFNRPSSLVLDGVGNIYVTEEGGDRIQKFRLLPPLAAEMPAAVATPPADPVEFVWQTEGGPDLPLADPSNPAVDPRGNLWVADGFNSRFQIFAPDGVFLESWGTLGSAEGKFDFFDPNLHGGYGVGSIAFDDAGNFYVGDTANRRVQKFGPDRTFLTAWGGEGTADGQFRGLSDLAVDEQGRVYVTDYLRRELQVFDGDGRFLTKWSDAGGGIAIDLAGNLWVSDYNQHVVRKFSRDGTLLATLGGDGADGGQLTYPNDVAVDGQGRVYVVEWGNSRVRVLDGEGRSLAIWGDSGVGDGTFLAPNGVALDSDGNVYVSDEGADRVQKFRVRLPPLAEVAPRAVETLTSAV
jgi:DNA-binding beta-propeller fold protein YncE